jgi:hypothetical protein
VARIHVQSAVTLQQNSRIEEFFHTQEDDIQQAEHDAIEDADRVHGFDNHVSAVVPWLRETGIADHIRSLRKNEIRAAIAVPLPGDESELRIIIDVMESLLRDAHRLCFDGPDCMLTYQCRVVLSRFQPSQVDLTGKTRPFDPYKGAKSLTSYFGTALRFVSYFSRVVAPDEYHFRMAADADDDVEGQRPEDIIEATDDQLAVWREICDLARQIRASRTEDYDDGDDNSDDDVLKERLLELWMLLICHTTGARRYQSPLLSFLRYAEYQTVDAELDGTRQLQQQPLGHYLGCATTGLLRQRLKGTARPWGDTQACESILRPISSTDRGDTDGRDPPMASVAVQSIRHERRDPRGILGRERAGVDIRKHRVANGSDPISARV